MCLPDPDLGWLCCRPARSAPVLCVLLTSLLSLHCQGEQGTPHTQQFHFIPSKKSFCPPPSLPPSLSSFPTSEGECCGSSARSSQGCSPPRISAGTWRGNNPWFHPSCNTKQHCLFSGAQIQLGFPWESPRLQSELRLG